jgi:hypothetical protein
MKHNSSEQRAKVNGADYGRQLHASLSRNAFSDLLLVLVAADYPDDIGLQHVCIESAFEQFDGMTRALDRAAEGF